MLDSLLHGLSIVFQEQNLIFCFIGVLLGTIVGTLPGIGPLATISILLPLTYKTLDPIAAIICLFGIFYGAQYGSSTAAILFRLPGEPSSVMTAMDGHALSKKGKAGTALGISAMASFTAGIISALVIACITIPMGNLIFLFGPVEYTFMMFFILTMSVALAVNSNLSSSSAMLLVGVLLSLVGTDITNGNTRFGFGIPELVDGISFVLVAMAVFGSAEMIYNLLHIKKYENKKSNLNKNFYPSKKDIKESAAPTLRGTVIGCIFGILPGTASVISSFFAYMCEKLLSKKPNQFGKGELAGVAAPEAANNAAAQASIIPVLSLGIPTTALMTIMAAALATHGFQLGPQLISQNQDFFWALVGSMLLGNIFLLILNLPLIGVWIKLLKLPTVYICTIGLAVCAIATYKFNNSWFDVALFFFLAAFGYLIRLLDLDPAPLALGMVIGPVFEENMRRAIIVEQANLIEIFSKPIGIIFLILSICAVFLKLYSKLQYKKSLDL